MPNQILVIWESNLVKKLLLDWFLSNLLDKNHSGHLTYLQQLIHLTLAYKITYGKASVSFGIGVSVIWEII